MNTQINLSDRERIEQLEQRVDYLEGRIEVLENDIRDGHSKISPREFQNMLKEAERIKRLSEKWHRN